MLWPYLQIWDWDLILGRAVKATSSLGDRSPYPNPCIFLNLPTALFQGTQLSLLAVLIPKER